VIIGRQLGQVLLTDVEVGTQRQGNGPPTRMPGEGCEADPNVAVDELLTGWTRRGIVVDSRPFDARAIARGRRVVDGQAQAPGPGQAGADRRPRGQRQGIAVAADGVDRVIGAAELGGNRGGSEPGRGRTLALGEQDSRQQ
jgi:hypothetical protein